MSRALLLAMVERAEYLRGRADRLAGKPIMHHGCAALEADEEMDGIAGDAYCCGYDPRGEIVGAKPGHEAFVAAWVERLAQETGVPPLAGPLPMNRCELGLRAHGAVQS